MELELVDRGGEVEDFKEVSEKGMIDLSVFSF